MTTKTIKAVECRCERCQAVKVYPQRQPPHALLEVRLTVLESTPQEERKHKMKAYINIYRTQSGYLVSGEVVTLMPAPPAVGVSNFLQTVEFDVAEPDPSPEVNPNPYGG